MEKPYKIKRELLGSGSRGYFVVTANGLENKRYEFSDETSENKALGKAQQHIYALIRRHHLVDKMNKQAVQK